LDVFDEAGVGEQVRQVSGEPPAQELPTLLDGLVRLKVHHVEQDLVEGVLRRAEVSGGLLGEVSVERGGG
jgi:hypothetical protein